MSMVWKQKPNSSRSATASLVVHHSAMLAGRPGPLRSSDSNLLFDPGAGRNVQISRMSPFETVHFVIRNCQMQIPTDIHGLGNAIEAVVWWVLGISMLIAAYAKPTHRKQCLVSAIALVLFGCSDVVEISTGAWWHPWWLLVWKGTCVITLCWQLYTHRIRSKKSKNKSRESKI